MPPTLFRVFLILLFASSRTCVQADYVSIIDPLGGGTIDEEIGNISESAFEALVPVVNDHENGTGPQTANAPFNIGTVAVTGIYAGPWTANLSGNRSSFTFPDGETAGTWVGAGVFPSDSSANYVKFNFAPASGEIVSAVGLAWIGRDNRGGDSTLTATVTFADTSTLSTTPFVIDGDGNGLPNGKDVFIGFQDLGNHGGITTLEVLSEQTFQSFETFQGWDDIGVVTIAAITVPEPSAFAMYVIAMLVSICGYRKSMA